MITNVAATWLLPAIGQERAVRLQISPAGKPGRVVLRVLNDRDIGLQPEVECDLATLQRALAPFAKGTQP